MLGIAAIHRLASSEREGLLLARILDNGRPLSLEARLRLEAPENLVPAARGLALLRLAELTHRPTRSAVELAQSLASLLRTLDRPIGWAGRCCALAGLAALLEQDEQRPGVLAPAERELLDAAVEDVLHDLSASWQSNRVVGKLGDDEIDTAIALCVLLDRPEAAKRLPLQAAQRWLEQRSWADSLAIQRQRQPTAA